MNALEAEVTWHTPGDDKTTMCNRYPQLAVNVLGC
jgi:hypothetical protein